MKRRNSHPHAPIQTLNNSQISHFQACLLYINVIQDSPFTHQTIQHTISKDSHFCFSHLLQFTLNQFQIDRRYHRTRSYIMAGVQSSSFLISSSSSTSFSQRKAIRAAINFPRIGRRTNVSLPTLQTRGLVEELGLKSGYTTITENLRPTRTVDDQTNGGPDPLVVAKLYAILEAVADRVEMHKNIGEQRDNWNSLLLTSINGIILAAAAMAGIAATAAAAGGAEVALKLSSTLMYLGATGMLTIMNKIQPSQLVEEQRNATRLFKNLYNEIQTTLSIGHPTVSDVKDAMERVLALDRAFPLPLLGVMLEKFPDTVEPAVWWPEQRRRPARRIGGNDWNGWNGKLEDDMKEITQVLRLKDKEDYLRLGNKALKINKILAISGPLLTGLAAVGSCLVGSSSPHNSWAAILGVTAGALASVVNTFQHGGQVGMVLEMYRCNAGFFHLIEQSIDSNLSEKDMERRENGEVFEMKVALKLGRSLSELRDLAAKSSHKKQNIDEFGSKLF
ncbi:PREDICTED: probable F-box protein At4g22030 [Ipomoea nil]|uniref:probable F-box protein At4g22030 n=1 Tax=Ipomoea nil TaxID=35883 RepID=UPI0009018ACB|nr:PREDICTED: probable F-box protein At4g22030 [Ipomoea nil]